MENRVAIIGIIVENEDSVLRIQEQLSKYSEYIIGRMGIPYRERNIRLSPSLSMPPWTSSMPSQEKSVDLMVFRLRLYIRKALTEKLYPCNIRMLEIFGQILKAKIFEESYVKRWS